MKELPYYSDLWLVPDGEYKAYISEAKEDKSPSGNYIRLTWKIIDGHYKGQLVYDNFYIYGSEKKNKIANNRLADILKTFTGGRDLEQLKHLVDKTATLTLKTFTAKNGEIKNCVAKRVFHIPPHTHTSSSPSSNYAYNTRDSVPNDIPYNR